MHVLVKPIYLLGRLSERKVMYLAQKIYCYFSAVKIQYGKLQAHAK